MLARPWSATPVFADGRFELPGLLCKAPGGWDTKAIAGWTMPLSGVEHEPSSAYRLGPAADGLMAVDRLT